MNSQWSSVIDVAGWTLLHFVWQGTLAALALGFALALVPRRWARVRYVVACVALLGMVALPVITASYIARNPAGLPGGRLPGRGRCRRHACEWRHASGVRGRLLSPGGGSRRCRRGSGRPARCRSAGATRGVVPVAGGELACRGLHLCDSPCGWMVADTPARSRRCIPGRRGVGPRRGSPLCAASAPHTRTAPGVRANSGAGGDRFVEARAAAPRCSDHGALSRADRSRAGARARAHPPARLPGQPRSVDRRDRAVLPPGRVVGLAHDSGRA